MYVCNCGEEFHAHEDRTIHSATCPVFALARKAQRAAMTTEQRAQDLVNGFFIGGAGDTLEGILTKADLVSAIKGLLDEQAEAAAAMRNALELADHFHSQACQGINKHPRPDTKDCKCWQKTRHDALGTEEVSYVVKPKQKPEGLELGESRNLPFPRPIHNWALCGWCAATGKEPGGKECPKCKGKGGRAINPFSDRHEVCPGCKREIDPKTCWCGDKIDHPYMDGHSGVPQGCVCHFPKKQC